MINPATILRCPIHGSIPVSAAELKVIDSRFFQRLRSISQLGFASLVYPGAVHSRFSHSLGAMHLASSIFQQVLTNTPEFHARYSKQELDHYNKILRLSALLHDVGHPPFSHSSEEFFPQCSEIEGIEKFIPITERQASHEDFSIGIIAKMIEEKEIELEQEELFEVIYLITGHFPQNFLSLIDSKKQKILEFLSQIISGEIDADRMDYLLRDSYFAGVTYGKFDLNRLLQYLTAFFDEKNDRIHLCLHEKALLSFDDFLLARSHMFIQVYYHKTLTSFEHYMKMALQEKEIEYEVTGEIIPYLEISEDFIKEQFRIARNKNWSGRIIRREVAKTIFRKIGEEKDHIQKAREINKLLLNNKIDSWIKTSKNVFSSQFHKSLKDKKTLAVKTSELGKVNHYPICKVSPLLKNSVRNIQIAQVFVLREDYKKALEVLK